MANDQQNQDRQTQDRRTQDEQSADAQDQDRQASAQHQPDPHPDVDGLADKKPDELTPEELRLMADTMPGEGPGD